MTDNTIVAAPAGFFQADTVGPSTATDLVSAVNAAESNIQSALTAETNAVAAAASATASSTSASASANSASTSATTASTAASSASASATTATTQAGIASSAVTTTSTNATNAANSATAAATSATNAASSASTASSAATAASTSQTNAATSATNASNSASTASTAATTATTASGTASTAATTATTQASAASVSAGNAATSATAASGSASAASTSATNAASSATAASTSATSASTSATAAAHSASLASAAIGGNTGRNVIHNPLFTVQQRGAGPFTTTGYTADRWKLSVTTDTDSVTVVTLADTDRATIGDEQAEYAIQHTFTGSSTANASSALLQLVEDAKRLSGKSINISLWARATSGSPNLGVSVVQAFGTGGSAGVVTGVGVITLTNTWARYGLNVTVPSASGKTFGTLGTDFTEIALVASDFSNLFGTGVGAQTGTIQYWGVQVEDASIAGPGNASPLEKRDPEAELRFCQRFFQHHSAVVVFNGSASGSGIASITDFALPTTMRTLPTAVFDSTTFTNMGTLTLNAAAPSHARFQALSTAAGQCSVTFGVGLSADL